MSSAIVVSLAALSCFIMKQNVNRYRSVEVMRQICRITSYVAMAVFMLSTINMAIYVLITLRCGISSTVELQVKVLSKWHYFIFRCRNTQKSNTSAVKTSVLWSCTTIIVPPNFNKQSLTKVKALTNEMFYLRFL